MDSGRYNYKRSRDSYEEEDRLAERERYLQSWGDELYRKNKRLEILESELDERSQNLQIREKELRQFSQDLDQRSQDLNGHTETLYGWAFYLDERKKILEVQESRFGKKQKKKNFKHFCDLVENHFGNNPDPRLRMIHQMYKTGLL